MSNFVFLTVMKLKGLIENIEKVLPAKTAMEKDRIGLQLQSGRDNVDKLLITYEVTDDVVAEAISGNFDCIITFHPLIWMPLLKIEDEERVGRLVTKLISAKIALISVHTTFDAYEYGTSRILLDKLGLTYKSFLLPDKEVENAGLGVIGEFDKPIDYQTFIESVSHNFIAPLKYCKGKTESIKTVAILGGSGSSMIDDALRAGVDAYITADCTYHQFHSLKGKMWLIDPGHYEMEQFLAPVLKKIIEKSIKENSGENVEIDFSEVYTNPVCYYPDQKGLASEQINLLTNRYGM